jgi:hypothetical protein
MSTLVLVLTAAMMVPGDGPEKVSWEVEQKLDLSGEWEGTFWDSQSKNKEGWTVKLSDDWLVFERGADTYRMLWQMTDEGGGKVKLKLWRTVYVGIYRQESDRVLIALCDIKKARPVSFPLGDDQSFLILHRAKPGSLRFLGIDRLDALQK